MRTWTPTPFSVSFPLSPHFVWVIFLSSSVLVVPFFPSPQRLRPISPSHGHVYLSAFREVSSFMFWSCMSFWTYVYIATYPRLFGWLVLVWLGFFPPFFSPLTSPHKCLDTIFHICTLPFWIYLTRAQGHPLPNWRALVFRYILLFQWLWYSWL